MIDKETNIYFTLNSRFQHKSTRKIKNGEVKEKYKSSFDDITLLHSKDWRLSVTH
jgi:hypothetical protein